MPNVTIGPYNTIAITAANGVYRLLGSSSFTGPVDVMNVGPGAVYIRADKDPAVNDPNSLELPANSAANRLMASGTTGLGIIAAADTTITVRV